MSDDDLYLDDEEESSLCGGIKKMDEIDYLAVDISRLRAEGTPEALKEAEAKQAELDRLRRERAAREAAREVAREARRAAYREWCRELRRETREAHERNAKLCAERVKEFIEAQRDADGFFPVKSMVALTEDYLTKRVSVKLATGEIVTGVVAWYNEGDFEEETGVECDWGFELDDAVVNGEPLGHSVCIPDSRIVAYREIDPPNTIEELERLGL